METPKITDWIQAFAAFGALIISTYATLKLIQQINLTREQINQTRKHILILERRERINAAFNYFTPRDFNEIFDKMIIPLEKIGINLRTLKGSLTLEQVNKIINDNSNIQNNSGAAVYRFLNYLEEYVIAIDNDFIDSDTAFKRFGGTIANYIKIFLPFIQETRKLENTPELYEILENFIVRNNHLF